MIPQDAAHQPSPASHQQPVAPNREPSGTSLRFTTECALVGVTIASIIGMHRLFDEGSYFGPLLLQLLLAHATVAVLRRRRIRLGLAAILTAGVAILAITWLQYADSAALVIPTADTLTAIDADMDMAWQVFRDVSAPAPVEPGFIVATSLAIWVIVFIADWGAFRTGVSFEALLPAATMFLFAAVLGGEGARALSAGLFVAACLAFLLLHRTWRQEDTFTWAVLDDQRGRWSLLSAGGALGAVAVVVAGVIGPNLPGAHDLPIVRWRDLGEKRDTRVVVSPLVDIRTRLVDQENVEVFTVEVDSEQSNYGGSYWRLTALDSFDGQIWRSSYETDDASGDLPDSVEADTENNRVTQKININALAQIWLPAAYEPVGIDLEDEDAKVDFDRASATLIVDEESSSSDGLSYEVTSAVPNWTAEQLRSVSGEVPDDISSRYLDLPDDFSGRIVDEANRIAGDLPTAYDKALALQTYLRDFDYSLDVQPGHSTNALEDFLFVNKEGYCEQFAGSFAAMARSLDLPSRVVVGFTPGNQDPNEPSLFRVTGKQAHAWAEVYFHGLGWVPFDPTPERAPPAASDWLGLEPEQDGQVAPGPGETPPPEQSEPIAPPQQTGPAPGGSNHDPVDLTEGQTPSSPSTKDEDPLWQRTLQTTGKPVGIGVAGYLVLVPLGLFGVRYGRRFRARGRADRVRLGWREVEEHATESGVALDLGLTVEERATRLRRALPDVVPEINVLAGSIEQVSYAEQPLTDHEANEATHAGTAVSRAALRRLRWHARILRYFDIRRLFPRTPQDRRSAHATVRTT